MFGCLNNQVLKKMNFNCYTTIVVFRFADVETFSKNISRMMDFNKTGFANLCLKNEESGDMTDLIVF